VTESEPFVSVPDSEPTQNLILSAFDQPSSSSSFRIQAAALKRHLRILHLVEQSTRPLMYLGNAPFYSELDYVSR